MPPHARSREPAGRSFCCGSTSRGWGVSSGSASPADRSWRRGRMLRRCRRSVTNDECKGDRDGVPESTRKGRHGGSAEVSPRRPRFRGPFDTFHRPEPYLEALGKLHHIVERVEPKKTFVDGDDVCILYDMVTNTPAGTAFICEWYRVRGDKSGSIRLVFAARTFAPMFNR